MITPMDIHNKEFEKGFRGYDSDAVDAFLAELVRDYETLYRDNREMTDKIEQLEKRLAQYEQMEATMNNTLVLAQETGENVKNAARKEAELIVKEAEQQRNEIMASAERSVREAQAKHAIIRNEISVFKAKVEALLQSQLKMAEGYVLEVSEVPTTLDERHVAAGHAEAGSKDDVLAAAIMKQSAGEV